MCKLIFGYTCLFILLSAAAPAQQVQTDSLTDYEKSVLDSLGKELDEFIRLGAAPKSFADISVTFANGYYDYKSNGDAYLNTASSLTFLPAITYYHKSGLALSATGCGVYNDRSVDFYQFILSPSFDYSKNKAFSIGVIYSHFFSKDSLPFYSTPLNNEIFFNFVERKWWLEPSVAAGFGWGSRSEYKRESGFMPALLARTARPGTLAVREESIRDLTLSLSVKHGFSWRRLFSAKDILLFTPELMITSGTHHFGFNTSYSFGSHITTSNLLPSNSYINDDSGLGLQSLTCLFRLDYVIRGFYMEPQCVLDYYLPYTNENRFHCIAGLSIGYNF